MDELRSDSWKCARCQQVIPSPGESKPPITCLEALGGCNRSRDDCEHGLDCQACYTRFFPADWHPDRVALYVESELAEGPRIFRLLVSEIDRLFVFSSPLHVRL